MRLRRVRKILEANPRGAQEVLDVVARHVEKRFGTCWTTHAELLSAAKILLAEEKRSGLAKRLTLRGELVKVATTLGLAAPMMREPRAAKVSKEVAMKDTLTADGKATKKSK